MSNVHVEATIRNNMLNQLDTPLNGGQMRFYDGAQPANVAAAITSQNLLATLTLNATFAPAASGGSKTANAITSAAIATTGTATWCSFTDSSGNRKVDGSVGTSGADVTVPTAAFQQNVTLSCSSAVMSLAA